MRFKGKMSSATDAQKDSIKKKLLRLTIAAAVVLIILLIIGFPYKFTNMHSFLDFMFAPNGTINLVRAFLFNILLMTLALVIIFASIFIMDYEVRNNASVSRTIVNPIYFPFMLLGSGVILFGLIFMLRHAYLILLRFF